MRGSKRMGIETVTKNNGERIIKKLWCRGGHRAIEVWRIGLSEHTKVVVKRQTDKQTDRDRQKERQTDRHR